MDFTLTEAPDARDVVDVLAAAFITDAHVVGSLPDGLADDEILRRLKKLSAQLLREDRSAGVRMIAARDASGPLGAALWCPPGRTPSRSVMLAGIPTYTQVFGPRLWDVVRTETIAARHRPRTPHWYLHMLGTTPAARGRGVGSALVEAGLAQADADGVPTYLESSSAVNLPFYRRLGFVPQRELHSYGVPNQIGMFRAPR